MIEESEIMDPKAGAHDTRYGETLLYDFAKFLTTLSLLALGGVVSITEAADRSDIKLFNILFVLGSIAIAGIISMLTANALVDARAAGKEPEPYLRALMKAAIGFLGVGTGGFLMIWLDKLT